LAARCTTKLTRRLRNDFSKKELHPKDLKGAVADAIVSLLAPIQDAYKNDPEWQAVTAAAYPDPNAKPEVKKKKKKVRYNPRILPPNLADTNTLSLQEKVYRPPPPGMGPNEQQDKSDVGGSAQQPESRRWCD
jgi:tyrosyl-tRNA synthetase